MHHPYDLIRAKLKRADEHLDCLHESIKGFIDTGAYRPFPDVDMEAGQSLIRVKIVKQPPLLEWAVVIGDVLHNLRSALDHLVWQLGGHRNPEPKNSEFPIFWDRDAYRANSSKRLIGLADHPQAIIEDLQPYHRRNPKLDPLWTLYELSNIDKHRLLHVGGAVVTGVSYFVSSLAGSTSEQDSIRLGTFEDGAVIASWPFDAGTKPQMNMPFSFTFGIAFAQEGPGRGTPVVQLLRRCEKAVDGAVYSLAAFLFD